MNRERYKDYIEIGINIENRTEKYIKKYITEISENTHKREICKYMGK